MKTELNIENWNRKGLYHFFKDFEEPFFGVTVNVDCTRAYRRCKERGDSFFLYYLHQSLTAANRLEGFRYRVEGERVFVYDAVHASTTVLRPDQTFGFACLEYAPEFEVFARDAQVKLEIAKQATSIEADLHGDGVIHYSTLPWLHFTALTHARKFAAKNSCPKISFGRMVEQQERKIMPVAIFVHHALLDGFAVGEYVDLFQRLLDAGADGEGPEKGV